MNRFPALLLTVAAIASSSLLTACSCFPKPRKPVGAIVPPLEYSRVKDAAPECGKLGVEFTANSPQFRTYWRVADSVGPKEWHRVQPHGGAASIDYTSDTYLLQFSHTKKHLFSLPEGYVVPRSRTIEILDKQRLRIAIEYKVRGK